MSKRRAKLTKVKINLPFGLGGVEFETDPTLSRAAWELYVELATRITTVPVAADEGILREALTSLHSLFASTREILRQYGPDVGASKDSVGGLAIAVLNQGLRPFLAGWHARLQDWESQRPPGVSPKDHEKKWTQEGQLRKELDALRGELSKYADALAKIAGVKT